MLYYLYLYFVFHRKRHWKSKFTASCLFVLNKKKANDDYFLGFFRPEDLNEEHKLSAVKFLLVYMTRLSQR